MDAAKNARIVIMNPPFSNRSKMGEKFPKEIQQGLRSRADDMEQMLVSADPGLMEFGDKNSIRPLFVALADHCAKQHDGVLTMIEPTIALSAPSGLKERLVLADRYHIHTVLTGRWPREFTLSQNVEIDECMVIAVRHDGTRPPTRFVHLDRMPHDEDEVANLHQTLTDTTSGLLADGWGETSYWPAERIEAGDWTPALWRSPELAKEAWRYANHEILKTIAGMYETDLYHTSRRLSDWCKRVVPGTPGYFPVIESKGTHGQQSIKSRPDAFYASKDDSEAVRSENNAVARGVERIVNNAGYLLVTAGQAPSTARVTAVASNVKYVGRGFLPITGPTVEEAKALAVFINSTAGRLQLLRNAGRKLAFPVYSPQTIEDLRIPNVRDTHIRETLSSCWEQTKDLIVPQFSEGECNVRRLWDEAVAEAMGWDADELARLRHLLHKEPHVRGLGYGQYADAPDIEPTVYDRFQDLADQWERETVLLSSTDQITEHPDYQEIISMGKPVVPLILERMKSQGGHWFQALHAITGADPVNPEERGNVPAMQESWLDWGQHNGLV